MQLYSYAHEANLSHGYKNLRKYKNMLKLWGTEECV